LHYVIYILVPVLGPVRAAELPPGIRMHLVGQGGPLARDLRLLVGALEGTPQDGFPSAHTSIALLVVAVARKRRLPLRWAFYVVAVPIIASTVLLGYHYVVDLVAALPLAGTAWLITQWSLAQQSNADVSPRVTVSHLLVRTFNGIVKLTKSSVAQPQEMAIGRHYEHDA
jgi:membrane-associated phospholipid phosphatase